jgi:hypothetical protein
LSLKEKVSDEKVAPDDLLPADGESLNQSAACVAVSMGCGGDNARLRSSGGVRVKEEERKEERKEEKQSSGGK